VAFAGTWVTKPRVAGTGIGHEVTEDVRVRSSRYDYDQVGNVAAISDAVTGNRGNRDMAYDALNRLTSTTSPMFGTASYTYDVLDNLTHVQVTGGSQSRNQDYCYDGANRLTNIKTGGCGGTSVIGLGYDVQGNLNNKNGVLFGFDYGNRLRSGGPETYRYDAYGRRVRAINATGGILYSLYGQSGQLLWQRDQRTSQRRNYVYLLGSLLAEHRRPIGSTTETIFYQHTDALGSPVATTDGAKTVLQRSEYEPYGYLLNRAMEDGPGYTGHATDAATGLVYMQQRYMDPQIGRFLSRDEMTAYEKPLSNFNPYVYANDNPYRFTDPDGRDSASCYSNGGCGGNNSFYTSREKLGSLADFVPVLGAIKGMVEAYQHPTLATVSIAIIGIVPEMGGFAKQAIKHSDEVVEVAKALRPADGSAMHTDEALDAASAYLGDGYTQVDSGVFRSADGGRQVRMTNSDLSKTSNHAGAPHMNFEEGQTVIKPNGKATFIPNKDGNSHVYLPDEN
jgi:RHS repeat-associated protein